MQIARPRTKSLARRRKHEVTSPVVPNEDDQSAPTDTPGFDRTERPNDIAANEVAAPKNLATLEAKRNASPRPSQPFEHQQQRQNKKW